MKTLASDLRAKDRAVQEAWIGDAVLSLYARSKILREDGVLDGAKCTRMTSNQFLAAIGEPTKVEAEVGRVYVSAGLNAAFSWIEDRIAPAFAKQEAKRLRKAGMQKRV